MRTAHGWAFSGKLVWLLRKRWGIPTVKVSSGGDDLLRWADGSYSVLGAAQALGVFPGTIYQYVRTGRVQGEQLAKGQPWRISLSEEQIANLRAQVGQARRVRKETGAAAPEQKSGEPGRGAPG